MPSRAELAALATVAPLALTIVGGYVLDRLGFGIAPLGALSVGAAGFVACCAAMPTAKPSGPAIALFVLTSASTAAYLWWVARPALLPVGGGPDLTHHLLLVEYLQQRGALVHDPEAWRELGEMADYTPGLHLLAVVIAKALGIDALFAVYPIIAIGVALKFGVFSLIVWRLAPDRQHGVALAIGAVGLVLHLSSLTLDSFLHDSFLAQVLSELFAVAMLWAVIAWAESRVGWLMIVAGGAGAAVFVTWPVWIGPLLVALVLAVATAFAMPMATRARHVALALAPVAVVAVLHTVGRAGALSIVSTSGALAPPSLPLWLASLPLVAIAGLWIARRKAPVCVLLWLSAGLIAQAATLWALAAASGAATPYMAIKMTYLLVYPVTAAALLAIGTVARTRWIAWAASLVILGSGVHSVSRMPRPVAVLDADLFAAGSWARTHLPRECVDYLVANEYTAYWLHLAVLRNPRMSARSANDDVYLTAPSFARWIEGRSNAPYAIAKWSVLPIEIRERAQTLHQVGDATVIARINSRPAAAAGSCGASTPKAGS